MITLIYNDSPFQLIGHAANGQDYEDDEGTIMYLICKWTLTLALSLTLETVTDSVSDTGNCH